MSAPTQHREDCGTHLGLRLHETLGEEPCATCLHGEAMRRLVLEYIPRRPPHACVDPLRQPISPEQGAANLAALAAALDQPRATVTELPRRRSA